MFGHQDDDQNQTSGATATASAPEPAYPDGSSPVNSDNGGDSGDDASASYIDNLASDAPEPEENTTAPAVDATDDQTPARPEDNRANAGQAPLADDKLLDIKKQALTELSPLVDHLNQSPEEKFKTTMMMIQAADNQALIPDAYKAAKDIADDKARAQALLDIVNEINYFTHKS